MNSPVRGTAEQISELAVPPYLHDPVHINPPDVNAGRCWELRR